MHSTEDSLPNTNGIFVLPNGLGLENNEIGDGTVVIIPRREEQLLQEQPILSHITTFEEKTQKLLVHLVRFPAESSLKISYYVSSWREVPDELGKYLDSEWLERFHQIVANIPTVSVLRKWLTVKAKTLPKPMINILLWLLVGLREPKLCPVEEVGFAERLFGCMKSLGCVRSTYRVEYSSSSKLPKDDLMRYEYGYFCEKIENVYGYLYHFQVTGAHRFFVDQPQHAFFDGDFNYLWAPSPIAKPICTLLVIEWTPKSARPFISYKVEVPRLDDPNFFYCRRTAGARVSHVVILEPNVVRLAIPSGMLCTIRDGMSVGTFILASLMCIAAWFKFKTLTKLR